MRIIFHHLNKFFYDVKATDQINFENNFKYTELQETTFWPSDSLKRNIEKAIS